jgi:hypothetical protein
VVAQLAASQEGLRSVSESVSDTKLGITAVRL